MNESKLIKKLNQRSRGALDQAVGRYTPYVSAVILRTLTGHACREDVEELCADVFVALWLHAFGAGSPPLAGSGGEEQSYGLAPLLPSRQPHPHRRPRPLAQPRRAGSTPGAIGAPLGGGRRAGRT